jgi:hypothetical protein
MRRASECLVGLKEYSPGEERLGVHSNSEGESVREERVNVRGIRRGWDHLIALIHFIQWREKVVSLNH